MMCRLALLLIVCASCRASAPHSDGHLKLFVTLGDSSGDGALPGFPYVGPRINGYYLVPTPGQPAEELVRVYDSTGSYVGTIGRLGEGPNEYRRPEFVYRVSDSAWIYDRTLNRVTALVPLDSTGVTRSWRYPPYSLLPLPDGTFVLSMGSWGSDRPLKHVDTDGELIASFGDSLPPGAQYFRIAHLASAGDSGFWSAEQYSRLELQRWEVPGHLTRSLSLSRDYFPEYSQLTSPTPTESPLASLVGFWADSSDALWLVSLVADPHWPRGLGAARQAEGRTYYPVEDWDKVFDTVVERVDSRTGASLGLWRVNEAILRVVEPWVLQSGRVDDDGWHQALLWRVPH